MKSAPLEFPIIFARLRAILHEHAAGFKISVDTASDYCLDIPYSPKFAKGFPIAWVKLSKSYVSFHFMPIYMIPALQKNLSKALKARMQGKSCFNFKVVDEVLFNELRALTAEGFKASKALRII
jgi:hypothetical protein